MNHNIEDSIISSLIISPVLWEEVEKLLKPEYFVELKGVFEIIYPTLVNGGDINIPIFNHTLKQRKIAWAPNPKVEKEWIVRYSEILKDQYISGRINQFAFDLTTMKNEAPDKKLHFIDARIKDINTDADEKADTRADTNKKAIEFIEKDTHMVPSAWDDINEQAGGWFATSTVIIGGRPGTGKSTILRQDALYQAQQEIPTAIITLETTKELFTIYLACSVLGLYVPNVFKGQITKDEKEALKKMINKIKKWPLYILDVTDVGNQAKDIDLAIRRLFRKEKIRLSYTDFLQIVDHNGLDEYKMLRSVVPMWKRRAMETGMTDIMFSQFNREVDKRSDKRPRMSDFTGGGIIEAGFDRIIGLYRPETYNKLEDQKGESLKGILEWIFMKDKYLNYKGSFFHKYKHSTGLYSPTNKTFSFEEEEFTLF